MEIPEYVRQHAPWSISKLGVIQKCSQQFDFSYTNKLPGGPPVKSKELRLGNAVHKVLELCLNGSTVEDAMPFGEAEGDLVSAEVEELRSFEENIRAFVKRSAEFCEKYAATSGDVVYPVKRLIEKSLSVDFDFKSRAFFDKKGFFRGKVDVGFITPEGHVTLIDHKTGKEGEASEFTDQFKVYAILLLAKYPEIVSIKSAVHFVRTGKMLPLGTVSAETIRNEYGPWLLAYTAEAAKKLALPVAPIPDVDPATGKSQTWICNWCAYKTECPKYTGM
jgi:hypothetical protein